MMKIPYIELVDAKISVNDILEDENTNILYRLFTKVLWKITAHNLRALVKKSMSKYTIINRDDIINFCMFATIAQVGDPMIGAKCYPSGRYVLVIETAISTYFIDADASKPNILCIEMRVKNKTIRKEYSEIYTKSETGSIIYHAIAMYIDKYLTS